MLSLSKSKAGTALRRPLKVFDRAAVGLLCGVLEVWHRVISPCLGHCCRFTPTCAEYAITALKKYGFIRGAYLSARRVVRCHPMCAGGVDPVP